MDDRREKATGWKAPLGKIESSVSTFFRERKTLVRNYSDDSYLGIITEPAGGVSKTSCQLKVVIICRRTSSSAKIIKKRKMLLTNGAPARGGRKSSAPGGADNFDLLRVSSDAVSRLKRACPASKGPSWEVPREGRKVRELVKHVH